MCAINKAEAAQEVCRLLGLQARGVSAGADGCLQAGAGCRAHPMGAGGHEEGCRLDLSTTRSKSVADKLLSLVTVPCQHSRAGCQHG